MLSKTLRRLEGAGLVSYPRRGDKYALTEVGASLLGPIGALVEWAETHTDEVLDQQQVERDAHLVWTPSGWRPALAASRRIR